MRKCDTHTAPDCFCYKPVCAACRTTTRCPECVTHHAEQIARETLAFAAAEARWEAAATAAVAGAGVAEVADEDPV